MTKYKNTMNTQINKYPSTLFEKYCDSVIGTALAYQNCRTVLDLLTTVEAYSCLRGDNDQVTTAINLMSCNELKPNVLKIVELLKAYEKPVRNCTHTDFGEAMMNLVQRCEFINAICEIKDIDCWLQINAKETYDLLHNRIEEILKKHNHVLNVLNGYKETTGSRQINNLPETLFERYYCIVADLSSYNRCRSVVGLLIAIHSMGGHNMPKVKIAIALMTVDELRYNGVKILKFLLSPPYEVYNYADDKICDIVMSLIRRCDIVGAIDDIKEIANKLSADAPKIYAAISGDIDEILKLRHSISLEKYRSDFFLECSEVLSAEYSKYKETSEKTISQLHEENKQLTITINTLALTNSNNLKRIDVLEAERSIADHSRVKLAAENQEIIEKLITTDKETIEKLVEENRKVIEKLAATNKENSEKLVVKNKEILDKLIATDKGILEKLITDNELVLATYKKKIVELEQSNDELKKFKADKRLDVLFELMVTVREKINEYNRLKECNADKRFDALMRLMLTARDHIDEYDELNELAQCTDVKPTSKLTTDSNCSCKQVCICNEVSCTCYPVCTCDNKTKVSCEKQLRQKSDHLVGLGHKPWCPFAFTTGHCECK